MYNFNQHFSLNSITLNITNDCNLSCKYCFETTQKDAHMSVEDAKKIVDIAYEGFIKNYPDLKYFMINIFGGEPLLNWTVIKALAEHIPAKRYKARIGITTNLTLLTDEMIDYIDKHEIFVLLSIDGIKSVHDRNRCGTYDVVAANINKLVAAELGYLLEARMTIAPEDARYITEGVKSIVDMGIYNIAPVVVTDVAWSEEDLAVLKEELNKLFDYYLAFANDTNNRKNVSIKIINDYIEDVLEPIKDEIEPCTAGTNRWCSIGIDGSILPCHQRHTVDEHYERLAIGNILADEIDASRIVNPEYKTPKENPRCQSCVALSVCRGGCPSENLTQNGDWHTPTKAWCDTMVITYLVAKENHHKILNAENLRVKQLNILKTNLQIKEYFEKLCDMNIEDPDFSISLGKFYGYLDDNDEILLPSFKKYYMSKLYPVYSLFEILKQKEA